MPWCGCGRHLLAARIFSFEQHHQQHEIKMNIQEILFQINGEEIPNYFGINREERNLAAILYGLLCKPNYLNWFLKDLCCKTEMGEDSGVYFEYAYLRDFWRYLDSANSNPEQAAEANISEINRIKSEFIQKLLANHATIKKIFSDTDDVEEINDALGVGGPLSKKYIQSPGRWSIAKLDANKYFKGTENDEIFLKLCMFKWAFNIKPDIVIHIDKSTAICIETKYESDESQYPTSQAETQIFDARWADPGAVLTPFEQAMFANSKHPRIKQMQLQKYMMEDLLGIKTKFVLIGTKDLKSRDYEFRHWKEVLTDTALEGMHKSVIQMAKVPSARRRHAETPRPP